MSILHKYSYISYAAFLIFSGLTAGVAHADCTDPPGREGAMEYFSAPDRDFRFCDGTIWHSMKNQSAAALPCGGHVGNLCADGTILAGWSVEGQTPLFTTADDAPSKFVWGPEEQTGLSHCSVTPLSGDTGCRTGKENTEMLAVKSPAYAAAYYCATLNRHGHSDWYLPSINELHVLYVHKGVIGGFGNEYYWSSSELNQNYAWNQYFGSGDVRYATQGSSTPLRVRCVRR